MMNPFGKKLTYNPVPTVIHWEIIGREKSGKSTLVAQLAKPGIAVVIDSDGRFGDSVPKDSMVDFYPLSDDVADMRDIDVIIKKLQAGLKMKDDVSMVVIDTITSILEPVIQNIQDSGKTNQFSYKEKASIMKRLRHITTKYGETAWLYHRKLYLKEEYNQKLGRKELVTKEKDYLGELEYSRLGANITITLKVVVDENKRRGVYVREARQGRSGFTIWDDSGSWQNFRQRIEDEVWGGLTKEDQDEIEQSLPESFDTPGDAVRWAWKYSQTHGNFFNDARHAQNSLKKLANDLKEQLGDEYSQDLVWDAWVEKVVSKEVVDE